MDKIQKDYYLREQIKAIRQELGDSNKSEIDEMKETLEYLVNANNLVIRSLFTVLGELSVNNDISGHIAEAQSEIQKFLTPVK